MFILRRISWPLSSSSVLLWQVELIVVTTRMSMHWIFSLSEETLAWTPLSFVVPLPWKAAGEMRRFACWRAKSEQCPQWFHGIPFYGNHSQKQTLSQTAHSQGATHGQRQETEKAIACTMEWKYCGCCFNSPCVYTQTRVVIVRGCVAYKQPCSCMHTYRYV